MILIIGKEHVWTKVQKPLLSEFLKLKHIAAI